jgi:hypothetical protein
VELFSLNFFERYQKQYPLKEFLGELNISSKGPIFYAMQALVVA